MQLQQEPEQPVTTSSSVRFSVLDEKTLDEWRRRGKIESRIIFFLTLGIFLSGTIALLLLYTKTAPSVTPAAVNADRNVYQESVAQQAEPEIEWLASQLKLGEDQLDKITPIVAEEQRRINQAVADSSLPSEARISKVNQIRLDTLASLAPMLKTTQSIRLKQLRDQQGDELRAVWNQSSGKAQQGN